MDKKLLFAAFMPQSTGSAPVQQKAAEKPAKQRKRVTFDRATGEIRHFTNQERADYYTRLNAQLVETDANEQQIGCTCNKCNGSQWWIDPRTGKGGLCYWCTDGKGTVNGRDYSFISRRKEDGTICEIVSAEVKAA